MAITWGPYATASNSNQAVGVEVTFAWVNVATGVGRITTAYWTHSVLEIGDSQVLTDSTFGDTHAYRLPPSGQAANVLQHIVTHSFDVQASFAGGPTYTFNASISQHWQGISPSVSVPFTVPPRVGGVPSSVASLTAYDPSRTTIHLNWPAPANNGSAIDRYQVQIARDSTFTSLVYDNPNIVIVPDEFGKGALALPVGTQLYARVRAHNAIGYGGWSPTAAFSTLSSVKVKIGGQWVNALVRVKMGGVWRDAGVKVKIGGQWVGV